MKGVGIKDKFGPKGISLYKLSVVSLAEHLLPPKSDYKIKLNNLAIFYFSLFKFRN